MGVACPLADRRGSLGRLAGSVKPESKGGNVCVVQLTGCFWSDLVASLKIVAVCCPEWFSASVEPGRQGIMSFVATEGLEGSL